MTTSDAIHLLATAIPTGGGDEGTNNPSPWLFVLVGVAIVVGLTLMVRGYIKNKARSRSDDVSR